MIYKAMIGYSQLKNAVCILGMIENHPNPSNIVSKPRVNHTQ